MYCARCGGQIVETDRFCPKCGSPQSAAQIPPDGYTRKQGIPGWAWAIIITAAVLFLLVPAIGIIAAIAVPTMISTRVAALHTYGEGVASTVRSAEAAYFAAHGEYGDFAALEQKGFVDGRFAAHPFEIRDFDGKSGVVVKIELSADKKKYEFKVRVDDTGYFRATEEGNIERVEK